MNKAVIAVLVLIVGAGLAFFVLSGGDDANAPASDSVETESNNNGSDVDDSEQLEEYTAVQVAEHDRAEDCWTMIDGNVYDITEYVSSHPGGDEILRACGTDGTTLFQTRTDEDGNAVGSGTPHSGSAENILARFQIGTVAQ